MSSVRPPDDPWLQRQRLIERIAHERAQLAHDAEPLRRLINLRLQAQSMADQAKGFVARHPLVVLGVVALVVVVKPRASLLLVQRALGAWRTWRSVRTLLPRSLFQLYGRSDSR